MRKCSHQNTDGSFFMVFRQKSGHCVILSMLCHVVSPGSSRLHFYCKEYVTEFAMNIDFSHGTISLVLVKCDMRLGFAKLSNLALAYLGIDICAGNDWVVFISKSKHIAKIIHYDAQGSVVITRKLNHGVFQQLMSKVDEPAKKILTVDELQSYLDGKKLEMNRTSLVYG